MVETLVWTWINGIFIKNVAYPVCFHIPASNGINKGWQFYCKRMLDSRNIRVQGAKITSWWGSILWNSKTNSTRWDDAGWRFMPNNKTVWKGAWSRLQTNAENVLLAGIALVKLKTSSKGEFLEMSNSNMLF